MHRHLEEGDHLSAGLRVLSLRLGTHPYIVSTMYHVSASRSRDRTPGQSAETDAMHTNSLMLAALLPVAVAFSAGTGRACAAPQQRRASAAVCAAAPSPAAIELKEELFELMREVRNRGILAPAELANDILEVATEMDDINAAEDWSDRDSGIGGTWRLMYTSSRSAILSSLVVYYSSRLCRDACLNRFSSLARVISFSPAQPLPTTKASLATLATLPAWRLQSCS